MQNTIHIMSIIKLGYWTVSIFKLLIHLILKWNIFEKKIQLNNKESAKIQIISKWHP